MGDLIVSTARMKAVEWLSADAVRVQPGISLAELDLVLATRGARYPPVPTYTGATVGGVVATNAAGAATFKYGSTRDWVRALTVVLPCGEVIDLERGEVDRPCRRLLRHPSEHADGAASQCRATRCPGWRSSRPATTRGPGMDLIDLFIGAEGTLGIVTSVTLRVVPTRPAQCVAFVPCPSRQSGLDLVRDLRDALANDLDGPRSERHRCRGHRACRSPLSGSAARRRTRPSQRRRLPSTTPRSRCW